MWRYIGIVPEYRGIIEIRSLESVLGTLLDIGIVPKYRNRLCVCVESLKEVQRQERRIRRRGLMDGWILFYYYICIS